MGIHVVQIVQVALDHFSVMLDLFSVMQQVGRRKGQTARAIDTACVPLSGHWSVWRQRRQRRRLRAARLRPRLRLRRSGFRQSLSRVQHTMRRRRRRRTWRAARPRGTMMTEAGPASLIWPRLQPAAEAPWLLVTGLSAHRSRVVWMLQQGVQAVSLAHAQLRRRHPRERVRYIFWTAVAGHACLIWLTCRPLRLYLPCWRQCACSGRVLPLQTLNKNWGTMEG